MDHFQKKRSFLRTLYQAAFASAINKSLKVSYRQMFFGCAYAYNMILPDLLRPRIQGYCSRILPSPEHKYKNQEQYSYRHSHTCNSPLLRALVVDQYKRGHKILGHTLVSNNQFQSIQLYLVVPLVVQRTAPRGSLHKRSYPFCRRYRCSSRPSPFPTVEGGDKVECC